MYKVINRFYDLKANHAYSVGDTFPHNSVDVDSERIAELASDKNRLGVLPASLHSCSILTISSGSIYFLSTP